MINYSNFFFITNFVLLLLTFFQKIIPLNIISYSDELLLINSFFALVILNLYYLVKKGKILIVLFLLIIVIGYAIINYFLSPFSNSFLLMLLQSLISIKLFIISLGFLFSYKGNIYQNQIIKYTFFFTLSIFIITIFLNFALGDTWNNLVNAETKHRFGVLRPVGILGGTSNVGNYFIITLTSLFFVHKRDFIKKKSSYFIFIYFILIFIGVFILTARKPLLILIPIALHTKQFISAKKFYFIYGLLAILFVSFIFFTNNQLISTTARNLGNLISTENNSYIRGLMFINSTELFKDFFPIGTSPATFGSNLSQINTMEVYKYTGISEMGRFVNTEHMSGVFDTGLGSLLAEFGFIGFLLLILFFIFNLRYIKIYYKNSYRIYKILMIYTILITFFGPGFMSSSLTVFFILNFLYIINKHETLKNNYENIVNK